MDESYNEGCLKQELINVFKKGLLLQKLRKIETKKKEIAEIMVYFNPSFLQSEELNGRLQSYLKIEKSSLEAIEDAPDHLLCSISLVQSINHRLLLAIQSPPAAE